MRDFLSLDRALEARSRSALRDAVLRAGDELSVVWAQKLAAHCANLESPSDTLRIGIVHSYTSELLDPWFNLAAQLQGLRCDVYHAPYGLSLKEAEPDSGLVAHSPDLTLFLLDPESIHPALSTPLAQHGPDAQRTITEEVLARLCSVLEGFRAQPIGHIVLTLLPARMGPGLGAFDAQSDRSQMLWWSDLKGRIAACLRMSMRSASLLDLDEVVLELGRRRFFDVRLWYSARFPFTAQAALEVTTRVVEIGTLIKRPKAKVIALDADNTLWGGIVGEDGLEGIALGPDYPGNCYLDFQRRILELQQRGFILALCSKNNAADVDRVLSEHPHQLIRDRHFAAKRVDWSDKPANLRALAEELNVGLDAVVFVDDSPHEIAAVRRLLPEVEAIQVPANPLDVPRALEGVSRFQILSLTDEDRAKTGMYLAERQRRSHKAQFTRSAGRLDDYLASLEMHMHIVYDSATHVGRLAQLTQKTNQFNLTTRRYNEQQIADCITSPYWQVAHFSLTDIFGHSGIVGLALIRQVDASIAELDTLLMSCRVIGREAEHAFLATLLHRLVRTGTRVLVADYIPTQKNGMMKDFLLNSGFIGRADGRYERRLDGEPAVDYAPTFIAVTESGGASAHGSPE